MLSPVSLAAFSTASVSPLSAPGAASTGPVARPFADPLRQAAPAPSLPSASGATPPRGSLLDLSV